MKRLIVLALVAAAAWYGWHHYGDVFTKRPSHEAVVVNRAGRGMARIRLTVGGQTFVKEALDDGASAPFRFRVTDDSDFDLVWQWTGQDLEQHWRGGRVPRGPMVQRHIMTVDGEAGVTYQAENLTGS